MLLSTFVLRLLASILAGGFVGLERQFNNKSAGFRTNTLVAMGACIYVLINVKLTGEGGDPTRIIGQIVTGIGFLGAGVIIKHGASVKGLTTAATVWCSAAAGALAAFYLVTDLILFTGTVILVNVIFGFFRKKDRV